MSKPLEAAGQIQQMDREAQYQHPDPISAPTKPLEADYTALNELSWCERLYYNRFDLGIVPADQPPATALEFGRGLHAARDILSTTGDILSAISKFDEVYTSRYEDEGWEDTLRTPYVGRALIYAYYQKWGLPKDLYTEIGAAVQLGDMLYYGRIDYIADNENRTVTDLKSTSALIWLPQARLNFQLIGYAHMAHELTGVKPGEVAIDGLIIPRIGVKMLAKGLPPEEEFALNIHDNLHRRTAPIFPRDYDEWHRWVEWSMMKINLCRETGVWPMRAPVACGRYNRSCDYDMLCKAQDSAQEERLRESLFVESRWHPFEGE